MRICYRLEPFSARGVITDFENDVCLHWNIEVFRFANAINAGGLKKIYILKKNGVGDDLFMHKMLGEGFSCLSHTNPDPKIHYKRVVNYDLCINYISSWVEAWMLITGSNTSDLPDVC